MLHIIPREMVSKLLVTSQFCSSKIIIQRLSFHNNNNNSSGEDLEKMLHRMEMHSATTSSRRRFYYHHRIKELLFLVLIFLGFSFSMTFYRIYMYNNSSLVNDNNCHQSTTWMVEEHLGSSNNYYINSPKSTYSYPRVVGYFPKSSATTYNNFSLHDVLRIEYRFVSIDPNAESYPSKRILRPIGNRKAQLAIIDDDDYYTYNSLNPDLNETCQLKFDWQKKSSPNCNTLHEFDVATPFRTTSNNDDEKLKNRFSIISEGYWRSVFLVNEDGSVHQVQKTNNRTKQTSNNNNVIFKSIRFSHEFSPRNLDRMRRDALIMEQLTSSSFVIDIYAFCGTSTFSEYGEGKDIASAIWPGKQRQANLSSIEKLHIATQAAIGLSHLHNLDSESFASVAHTDISPNQYIKVKGIYKLNDFNRARFLPWSTVANISIPCSYHIGNNPGKNRAPEEYKFQPQSEKVDIYSLGNIFYMLLQEEYPFHDVDADEAQQLVMEGHRPSFYIDIWNSTDPVIQALKSIMIRCHEQYPNDRPSAREIELYLKSVVQEYDPDFQYQ